MHTYVKWSDNSGWCSSVLMQNKNGIFIKHFSLEDNVMPIFYCSWKDCGDFFIPREIFQAFDFIHTWKSTFFYHSISCRIFTFRHWNMALKIFLNTRISTLLNSSRTDPGRRERINLNFYKFLFSAPLWYPKSFYEVLKDLIKPSEMPQRNNKIKISVNFYCNITFWNARGKKV